MFARCLAYQKELNNLSEAKLLNKYNDSIKSVKYPDGTTPHFNKAADALRGPSCFEYFGHFGEKNKAKYKECAKLQSALETKLECEEKRSFISYKNRS